MEKSRNRSHVRTGSSFSRLSQPRKSLSRSSEPEKINSNILVQKCNAKKQPRTTSLQTQKYYFFTTQQPLVCVNNQNGKCNGNLQKLHFIRLNYFPLKKLNRDRCFFSRQFPFSPEISKCTKQLYRELLKYYLPGARVKSTLLLFVPSGLL